MNITYKSKTVPVKRYRGSEVSSDTAKLINEDILTVRINGENAFAPARTPGHEAAQAAGLCVGAGYELSPENIIVCDDLSAVDVSIPERGALDPRPPFPVRDAFMFSPAQVVMAGKALHEAQSLRRETFSTHAAVIFDETFSVISASEDVSRHSAIDKAIGMAFLNGKLSSAKAIMLTCRQNSDVMLKIVNARIPVVLSVSRPTVPALDAAMGFGLTVALLGRNDEVVCFCGEHRILCP